MQALFSRRTTMNISLHFKSTSLQGAVDLPASKSISNRVLIINALADSELPVENLADCDDTQTMLRVLSSDGNRFDIGHAGTAMRFLTAYLSRIVGRWELTGSERMKQRPVGVLVDALNQLGARIEYIEKPGFPPLAIYGSFLTGGEIEIPASVSSQYISALMMVAPYMMEGLTIRLTGNVVSGTYIDMTMRIMQQFGARVSREDTVIRIDCKPYEPVPYRIESDWSAASYFFELLAIAEGGEISLSGLRNDSVQGDARQVEVWEKLGVTAVFQGDEVILKKGQPQVRCLEYDFVDMPDLVQSFAVACCMMNIPFAFKGVETLRIKETDRIEALIAELAKLGYCLHADGDSCLKWTGEKCLPTDAPEIATYHDHRMAMAFAPAALKHPGLVIADKDVVTKSFPRYWEEVFKCTGGQMGREN